MTPLSFAVRNNIPLTAKLLIEWGANIDAEDTVSFCPWFLVILETVRVLCSLLAGYEGL
jgi:hypothetical protein